MWQWAWRAGAGLVAIWGYGLGCLAVYEVAEWGEEGGGVDAEDGGETGSVDLGFFAIALYCVLDAVEEEIFAEESEEWQGGCGRDVGFEVEEVEGGLIVDLFTGGSRDGGE